MNTYISILRGINVGGKHLIKMDALRAMYEKIGLKEVSSYVQSGNVIFVTKKTETHLLATKISDQIELDFGLDVPVFVLSVETLRRIVESNPLAKNTKLNPSFLHVTFLSSTLENIDLEVIEQYRKIDEEFSLSDEAVYLYCPSGYGKTKLTNNFLEKKLQVRATTRNWKTTNELLKMTAQIHV